MNYISGTNRTKSGALTYTGTTYAQLPLPHSDNVPAPVPSPTEEYSAPTFESAETGETGVSMYEPSNITAPCNHIEITQNRLDIMVRHLKLS